MGSAVGAALAHKGTRVVATIAGRSARTQALARAAAPDVELLGDLDAVVAAADVVLSILPPEHARAAAVEIAKAARRTGASPLVADLNAIAPATMRELAGTLAEAGLDAVDGSISGPPPRPDRTTTIYLSGPRGQEIAALEAEHTEWLLVGPEIGVASAVKMCTASVYKGSVALLTQALRTAREHGVVAPVVEDLTASFPDLLDRAGMSIALGVSKAERYVPEMREIAATQAAAGLPGALFDGVAEVYAELARRPTARTAPEDVPFDTELDDVLGKLVP